MRDKVLKRRMFLQKAGIAMLVMSVSPLAFSNDENASADFQFENDPSSERIRILSGKSRFVPLSGHRHYLEVSFEVLARPPKNGVKLTTSRAYFHTHEVQLSKDDLIAISQGHTVKVRDLNTDHLFTIGFDHSV